MNDSILTIILIVTVILFFLRYSVSYLWKRDALRQDISFMNDKLSISKNVEREIFHLSGYRKKAFLQHNDYLVRSAFLTNPRYKSVIKEYEDLERYGKQFWRLEGLIYLVICLLTAFFLMI